MCFLESSVQERFGNPLGPPEQTLPKVRPGVPGITEVNDCQSLRLRDPPRAGRHEVEAVRVHDRGPLAHRATWAGLKHRRARLT